MDLFDPAGRLECLLAVPGVDVEQPALDARGRRGLRLIDRDREAVQVQNTGQDETDEAGSNDGN